MDINVYCGNISARSGLLLLQDLSVLTRRHARVQSKRIHRVPAAVAGGIKRYHDPSVCLSVRLSQGAAGLGAQLL